MTKKLKHIIHGGIAGINKTYTSSGGESEEIKLYTNNLVEIVKEPLKQLNATTDAKSETETDAKSETETDAKSNDKQPYDNEYKVTLKVSPSTVKNKDGKATIGDIKIVYDSNHRINSTPDQVDYYLLELARYLKWLTTKDTSDETGSINDFLKSEQKNISFIKNVPVESENTTDAPVVGGSRIRRTKRRRTRKNVTKKRK